MVSFGFELLAAGLVNLLIAIIMYVMYVMTAYLTDVWKLSVSHAAGIINIWTGLSLFLPIPFAFFADSFSGNSWTLLLSGVFETIGLGLLTLSTPHFLGPCNKSEPQCIGQRQKTLYYIALALMAAGLSGLRLSHLKFFKQPKKEEEKGETTNSNRKQKNCECSSLNQTLCWCVVVFFVVFFIMLSSVVLPFIQSWSVKFGVPAICSFVVVSLLAYGHFMQPCQDKGAEGSPLKTILRVFVAAMSKCCKELPQDPNNEECLYQSDDHVELTRSLRCLNKAAIILSTPTEEQKKDKWHLCSVQEVEDTKVCLKMAPLGITLILCGLVLSLENTYFVDQANNMNNMVGGLKVSNFIFFLFSLYSGEESLFSKWIYRMTKKCSAPKYKDYFPVFGIGFAIFLSSFCCIIAALVESWRLKGIKSIPDPENIKSPLSMFALIPQYLVIGVVKGIAPTCYEELFKTRYPSSMKKYIQYFTSGLIGMGTAASYLLVYIVGKVSGRGGRPSWFQQTLNKSRLDNYYWTLAVIAGFNLLLHIIISFILPPPKPKPKPEPATRIHKLKELMDEYLC